MTRFALALLALVLGACPSSQRTEPTIANAQPARPAQPAPAIDERDVIVKTVLERFIADPNSMPDDGLLPDTGPIYVLAEIGEPVTHTVAPASLPNNPRPFVLKPLAELQAEADRTKATVAFIRFYELDVHDSTSANVSIGADIALPSHSNAIKMCCCSEGARWEKHDGRWTPGGVRVMSCS